MLHLVELSDDAARQQIPLAEPTAAALERALLAHDRTECQAILRAAMADDATFSEWAIHEAHRDSSFLPATADAAAVWWSAQLATKLAPRLLTSGDEAAGSIHDRLPQLTSKLADFETQLSNFDDRLEREKLEAMKELAYGAGHEINNPLANIAARAQTLLEEETLPERQRKLSAIHRQAMRAHEMIADLMLFSRPPKLIPAPCDLSLLVGRVAGEMDELASERAIQLSCDTGAEAVVVQGDATQLAVAVKALITNSLEAVGSGGQIFVTVRREGDERQPWAEVIVRDNGPGISDEVRRHLFDPFFSGREAGRGLGFGLSKCWRIVTDHGGRIIISSTAGHGTELTIVLPLSSGAT